MSKNLSDIFPPTEIGGGGGGIEEAPKTGKLYARKDEAWQEFDAGNLEPGNNDNEVLVWDNSQSPPEWMPSTTVPTVRVQETAPLNPKPGALWMEVPSTVDEPAMMWVYDGAKWLEHPSGVDGAPGADGNIQDATEDGVIATWNSTDGRWTPESAVVVDSGSGNATFSGRVGIHDSPVGGEFVVKVGADNKIAMNTASYGSTDVARISAFDNAVSTGVPLAIEGKELRLRTDTVDRLTIDPTGHSTFSGKVSIGDTSIRNNEQLHIIGTDGPVNDQGNNPVAAKDFLVVENNGNANINLLGADGTFPAIKFNTPKYGSTNASTYGALIGFDTVNRDAAISFQMSNPDDPSSVRYNRFLWNSTTEKTDFSCNGEIYKNTSTPVISTIELIETLHTLREATKDETTIKGLRDAIGNAVGGLIEKFEAMQNEAVTQEITDEE